jgi:hypothetical protein
MNALVSTPAAQAIISEAVALAATVADELIEAFEREAMVRAGEMIQQWELLDPRDRWRQTGDAPPPIARPAAKPVAPYRTPEATQQAFWYVVRLADPERLAAWLDDHPQDESFLLKLLECK